MKLAIVHFGRFLDELDRAGNNSVDIIKAVKKFKKHGREIEEELLKAAKTLEELEECHCGKNFD